MLDVSITIEAKSPENKGTCIDPVWTSREKMCRLIWKMHEDGNNPAEIAAALNAEGYYYAESTVRARLRAQGADL